MTTRLNSEALAAFMRGQSLYAFDPATQKRVALVHYGEDSSCVARFEDGTEDAGQWGLSGDQYWTRYTRFRAGQTNRFYLVPITDTVVQAYHYDGRRAFLQSHSETIAYDG